MRTARRGKRFLHRRLSCAAAVCAALLAAMPAAAASAAGPAWPQWGGNPEHDGLSAAAGQRLTAILADAVIDPFVPLESAEGGGDLFIHYAVALVDGSDVYIETKSGSYIPCDPPGGGEPFPCGPDARDLQIWNVTKLSWMDGALVEQWTFQSDWKPDPIGGSAFEPVFHPALAGAFLYVPGMGGTIHKVSKATGLAASRINPFSDLSPSRFVAGGLAADADGRVVYNAIEFDPLDPWRTDVVGAWLVRVGSDDAVARVSFAQLTPGAPAGTGLCQGTFTAPAYERPYPPSPTAVPPSFPCGSQRPGLNVVPAIAADGTIYTVSRAHFNARYGYLVAVHPDLTPAWSTSFRGYLNDGCGVLRPIDTGDPLDCRAGATLGVDPSTNDRPAGRVDDAASSSPVVLPDGSVLYGVLTTYNYGRGHLFKLDRSGHIQRSYDFGWDITPAIRVHDGTYSIVIKDNHYGPEDGERYNITSLDANLVPEWSFTATNTESCARQGDGSIVCVEDHPNGFEWCVNQPAVDAEGISYGTSEDGNLYSIDSTGRAREKLFLDLALGAAYTPLSIGSDGRIYAQNNGHLFVIGVPMGTREQPAAPDHARQATRTLERR